MLRIGLSSMNVSVTMLRVFREMDQLLSLMEEMNDPCRSYQTDSHSGCEGEALGVSWCLDRLPEYEWSPDCSRLSYGVHSHQGE